MTRFALIISVAAACFLSLTTPTHAASADTDALPSAPDTPQVRETATEGEVSIQWSAPATDENGNRIDPATLTYTVYNDCDGTPVASGLTELSYVHSAVAEGDRAFVSYRVSATSAAGEGLPSEASTPLPVGAPYRLPYFESFAGQQPATIWSGLDDEDSGWLVTAYSDKPMTYSHDNDGGMLAFMPLTPRVNRSIESGKINIGDGSNPCLKLWVFNTTKHFTGGDITIYINAGEGFKHLRVLPLNTGRPDGWYEQTVMLTEYSGRTIRLRLTGWCAATDVAQLIDKISITDIGHDLAVSKVTAPDKVNPGNVFMVDGKVTNNSSATVSDYEVRLYRDGELVDTQHGKPLSAGSYTSISFTQRAEANWNNRVLYRVEVKADGDNVPDNDTSESVAVTIDQNAFPSVADIKAYWTDNDRNEVSVSWSEPDFEMAEPVVYTEGFEYFPAFEINPVVPGWTFYDGDAAPTYGIDGYDFDWAGNPMAFMAVDSDRFTGTVKAKFGRQFMISMDAMMRPTDDWLISPELSGEAQVITFWVRSLSTTYGTERYQVLGSLGSRELHEFQLLKYVQNLPATWTKYTCKLPKGTKYFAIRNISQEAHGLLVDEVTYIPGRHPAENYEITGYNIYRDGIRLNDTPIAGMTYSDTDLPDVGRSSYAVSVVYDRGESPVSAYVEPTVGVVATLDEVKAEATAVSGGILIRTSAPADFCIHSLEGALVFEGRVADSRTVLLEGGVYVVTSSGFSRKVMVR